MSTRDYYPRVQKFCTLWTHDTSYSSEDVVFNLDRFKELGFVDGSLAQIILPRQGTAVRDFQDRKNIDVATISADSPSKSKASNQHDQQILRPRRGSMTLTFDESGVRVPESRRIDAQWSYMFVVKDASPELKARYAGLQISVSNAVAAAFGFRNRMQVLISTADESEHSASHVEISFRDEYLSRADMWRMAISELSQRTVYRDQRLLFLGTIKATVKNVWIDGQRRKSGYFNASTKPIFRSESARYILFIQMSREMWDFDSEGAGEIMFNKVIHGFLPELFKNWLSINAHHLVTIVMFTRLEYETDTGARPLARAGKPGVGGLPDGPRDFYRVVVSEMSSNDWIKILYQLKKEFRTFLRDVSIQPVTVVGLDGQQLRKGASSVESPEHVIVGKPTSSSEGNVLEAINLASSQFARDYIDRDLVRTGISVVVITAGTGVYEVDYSMLKLTTDTLIGSGIGIDLVCLSPMPLHSVPLFKYRNPKLIDGPLPLTKAFSADESTPRQFRIGSVPSSQSLSTTPTRYSKSAAEPTRGEWSYAMPHWIDISFWTGTADEQAMMLKLRKNSNRLSTEQRRRDRQFDLRCRMYELQMMGVMENEMTNIMIQHLHENPLHPWQRLRPQTNSRAAVEKDRLKLSRLEREWMDEYDANIFRPLHQRRDAEAKARAEALGQRPTTSSQDTLQLMKSQYKDTGLGPGGSNYRPNAGFLDWKLKEKTPPQLSSTLRKPSTISLLSTAESISSQSSRISRQISFGMSTIGASKAMASMDISTASADIKPATLSKDHEGEVSLTTSKYTQQFRAVLTRNASESSPKPGAPTNNDVEGGSKPIKITSARPPVAHSRTSSSEVNIGSATTLRADGHMDDNSARNSPNKPHEPGPILHAASTARVLGPRPDLASSADGSNVPQTLSPTSALAPWLVLVNPCNPRKNDFDVSNQFRRWQHVFPKRLRTASMKWKSLCSPASVPLTNDYFPTVAQLENEYEESPYRLSPNMDDEIVEAPRTRDALMRELMAFRLAHGFQLVVGPLVSGFLGAHGAEALNIFDHDYMARDGATIFMSVASTIHQLVCTASGEIEIRRYNRKPTAAFEPTAGGATAPYKAYIRTALETKYEPREITFKSPRTEYNWNFIDTFIAGYHEEFSETLRFWRARFVLIPVEVPARGRRPLPELAEDSSEEIRLEGIRKLTQIWQRHRVLPHDERNYQSMQRRKDPNPLAIEYQTRDPSAIVAAGPEGVILSETDSTLPSTSLFSESETYTTKNVDLQKLAQDLQGDKGVQIIDRRWHWRLHYHSFSGFDFVNWLLDRFRDLETREEAEAFGNELMEQGLFHHSQRRHKFRDGNFFYRISEDYRVPEARMSWFGTRRGDRSVPQTPMTERPKLPVMPERLQSRVDASSSPEFDEKEGEKTPTKSLTGRRKVTLSHVMRYDVDPRKKSYRPEIINLHYDRLHNPDNCYHIRIDWMNVTAKFIEDAIGQWAISAERFGLKLVEVPIAEAASICDTHPFRSPYLIQLAASPPAAASIPYFDATSFGPQSVPDKWAYHKALLKKFNFVLDVEASSSFPSDVDVTYSWGKPDYRYTQYIHKTGVVLAQITDDGQFLMLANRLYNNRSTASRLDTVDSTVDRPRPASAHHQSGLRSPTASPLARPVPEFSPSLAKEKSPTAEDIKDDVEAFCKNADALRTFYETAIKPPASPSPRITPTLSGIDAHVPSLRLPPPTTVPGRDVSPQASKTG